MNPVVEKVLWLVGGGLIGKYFDKFKKRIKYAEYSINVRKIGLDQHHLSLGNLEIRFNGDEISSPYICEIIINNTTGIDLENSIITVDAFNNDVFILNSIPNIVGGMIYIPFSSDYQKRISYPDPNNPTNEARHFFFHEKEYQIPLLNRGKIFTLTLFCQSPYATPVLNLTLKHRGVELRPSPAIPTVLGESPKRIFYFGVAIVSIGWAAIIQYSTSSVWASVLSMMLGLLFLVLGAVASKIWTFIVSLFD